MEHLINDLIEALWWCKGGVAVQTFIPTHHFLTLSRAHSLTLALKPQLCKIKLS